jgi:hypothetical protein
MSSRVSIYDKSGQWLTEVNTTFNRVYKLNEFGIGSFALSTDDDKCREDYLQFGNYVYVEHDKLPVWAGMIEPPRIWGQGQVTSTVYSAEYILSIMISDRTIVMRGAWGSVYQQLITQMFNNDAKSVVRVGNIFGGGKVINRTYNYANLYDEVKLLCRDSGNDFEFEPDIDANGRLFFSAHWHEKRGALKQFVLDEGTNIQLANPLMREQGRIANALRIYGDGATFESRPVAKRDDYESRSLYGQRWLAQAVQGDDLAANADELIKEYAHPRKTFNITALDVGDTFYQCRVGDMFPVSFFSVGFSGSGFGTSETARILQMDYKDNTNTLSLVADQVR